ncbi:hypothetical protein OAR80_04320 [Methylophilaceae bacterium]|nr:hypothetical protein [Methylophilaceae bacterium]
MKKTNLLFFLLIISTPSFAYIGPGMGGGAIAAVLGVIGAIFLALFGIVYYPIKRYLRNKNKKVKK